MVGGYLGLGRLGAHRDGRQTPVNGRRRGRLLHHQRPRPELTYGRLRLRLMVALQVSLSTVRRHRWWCTHKGGAQNGLTWFLMAERAGLASVLLLLLLLLNGCGGMIMVNDLRALCMRKWAAVIMGGDARDRWLTATGQVGGRRDWRCASRHIRLA